MATIEERITRLESMLQTLAKASNYQFPADEFVQTPKGELASFKESLRKQFWKTYPQGDYLFEDFLVRLLYEEEKK